MRCGPHLVATRRRPGRPLVEPPPGAPYGGRMANLVSNNPEGDLPGKPTSASRTTLSHIMTASHTNLLGTVHGGVIMKLVDDAAGAVAGRHSGGPAVTASLDEMA